MDSVAAYLEIPADLEDSFLSLSLDYHENTGSTGDMTYSYYFEVPEDTSDELLSAMPWAIGDTIELPVHVVEADDADDADYADYADY